MANNIFIRKTTIQTRFMTLHNKARPLFTIAKQRERANNNSPFSEIILNHCIDSIGLTIFPIYIGTTTIKIFKPNTTIGS